MEKEEHERVFHLQDHHWWFEGKRSIVKAVLDQLGLGNLSLRILDVGCGTGGMFRLLKEYGAVTGIDISETALSLCASRYQSTLCQSSALQLPFQDESFDLVTAFDVLYHKWVEDDQRALLEMARVCRQGGTLLITDSAFGFLKSPHDVVYHARHRYTAPELMEKVTKAGFLVRRASYANTLLFPLALVWRTVQRILTDDRKAHSDLRPTPGWLNSLLIGLFRMEAFLIKRIDLPLGVSVLCLAQRRSSTTKWT